MPRARSIRIAWLLVAVAAALGCEGGAAPGARGDRHPRGPHVLLVTIDSLRADHLGCYGYERDTSPNLDALCEEGVRFERAYSHAPFTPPAHASLLTGLNVPSHGILSWGDALPPEARTLGERLGARGWRTGAFYNHPGMRPANLERGFDAAQVRVFEEASKTVDAFAAWLDEGQGAFCAWIHLWDVHRPYGWRDWRSEIYRPEAAGSLLPVERAELTLAFEETTFGPATELGVGRDEAHYNVTPAERASKLPVEGPRGGRGGTRRRTFLPADWRFVEDRYDGGVVAADRGLAALLDSLRERGLYEDTLVIVTADHGESLTEREAVWFTHDPYLYEETLHVPLVIKFPGARFAGREVGALVRGIDVLPTVLEVADVGTLGNEQGTSLVELLDGRRDSTGPLFAQTQTRNAKETGAKVQWGRDGWLEERLAWIEDTTKLVRDESAGTWTLYDLASDPGERRDLAGDAAWSERFGEVREDFEEVRAVLPRAGAGDGMLDEATRLILNQMGYTGDGE